VDYYTGVRFVEYDGDCTWCGEVHGVREDLSLDVGDGV
jgi:hypothetical protein